MIEAQPKEGEFANAVIALYGRAEVLLNGYPKAPFEVPATAGKPAVPISISIEDQLLLESQEPQTRKPVIKIRTGRIEHRVDQNDPTSVLITDFNPKPKQGFFDKFKSKPAPKTTADLSDIIGLLSLLENAKLTEQEQRRRQLDLEQKQRHDQIKQLAQQSLENLDLFAGDKSLLLIIDDSTVKTPTLLREIKAINRDKQVLYEAQNFYTGEEGLTFYRAICELEDPNSPHNIAVLLDGNLAGTGHEDAVYKTGEEVAAQIALISKEHGLRMPYMIGLSTDYDKNEDIKRVSPDAYIGTFYDRGFDDLRERLHSV